MAVCRIIKDDHLIIHGGPGVDDINSLVKQLILCAHPSDCIPVEFNTSDAQLVVHISGIRGGNNLPEGSCWLSGTAEDGRYCNVQYNALVGKGTALLSAINS